MPGVAGHHAPGEQHDFILIFLSAQDSQRLHNRPAKRIGRRVVNAGMSRNHVFESQPSRAAGRAYRVVPAHDLPIIHVSLRDRVGQEIVVN